MFKLFGFLSDQKKLNTKGIGLGLVIAKQIVKQYNGDITVDSEKDQGATFTFTMRLEDEPVNHQDI